VDQTATENLFRQTQELWIDPEFERRRAEGRIGDDFVLEQCLIKLPGNQPPIVLFNDEVRLEATVKLPDTRSVKKGDPLGLSEIERIESVRRPEVDGIPVAYLYLLRAGNTFNILFDFTPNAPPEWLEGREDKGEAEPLLTGFLQDLLLEKVVSYHQAHQEPLSRIGLWPVPCLLPYPLSRIIALVQKGDYDGARELLVQHCTPDLVEGLSENWWSEPTFAARRQILQDALGAHRQGTHTLSIHTLMPQVEGIITDWIHEHAGAHEEVPFRAESKTRKFGDLVVQGPLSSDAFEKVVAAVVSFIVEGPVLQTFKTWFEEIDNAFPGRHVVGHGRHDQTLFTEENSVKLILLLDTIYRIVSRQLSIEPTLEEDETAAGDNDIPTSS
jgi:hypothetical protein